MVLDRRTVSSAKSIIKFCGGNVVPFLPINVIGKFVNNKGEQNWETAVSLLEA